MTRKFATYAPHLHAATAIVLLLGIAVVWMGIVA